MRRIFKLITTLTLALGATLGADASTIVGTFRNPNGTRFNGQLVLTLPFAGVKDNVTGSGLSQGPVTYNIVNGEIPANANVVGNDSIFPGNTYYVAMLYDSFGKRRQMWNVFITGGVFDLAQSIQTTVLTSNVNFSFNQIFSGALSFADFTFAASSNPGASKLRLFANSANGRLTGRTSTGTNINMELGTLYLTNGIAINGSFGLTGQCLVSTGTGTVYQNCPGGAGGGSSAGPNGQLQMSDGSGGFLGANLTGDAQTSNGTAVTVSRVNGVTYPSNPLADTVPVVIGGNSVSYQLLVNCPQALTYNTTTHSWGCNTGVGTVTNTLGNFTANQLLIAADGGHDAKALGSSGSGTTVLHGGTPPVFASIVYGDISAASLSGNGGKLATVLGSLTHGNCVRVNSGALEDAGAPCGSGGGGAVGSANVLQKTNGAGVFQASSIVDDGTLVTIGATNGLQAAKLATTGSGALLDLPESTEPAGVAAHSLLWADNTHRVRARNNAAASGYMVERDTVDTLTNKTFNAGASGNTLQINGTTISSVSGNTSKVALVSGAVTNGNVAKFDAFGNIVDGGASSSSIAVQKGGSAIGTRGTLNFIEGSNVTITAADNPGSSRVDVTIASSGGGGGGFDPLDRSIAVLSDEFCGGTTTSATALGQLQWTSIGTGQSIAWDGSGSFAHPCYAKLQTGATLNNWGALTMGQNNSNRPFGNLAGNTNWGMVWIFQLSDTSAGANMKIGMANVSAVTAPDALTTGMWIKFDTGDGAFKVQTCDAGTCTTGGTTYTLDTGWHSIKIYSTVAGQIKFSFDGGVDQTLSTNVSTATMTVYAGVKTGAATNMVLMNDYFGYKVTGLTR